MSESPLIGQYESLLNQLQATVSRRLEHEAHLQAIENAADQPYPQQLETEQEQISADFEARLQTVYDQKADALSQVELTFETDNNRIEGEYRNTLHQLNTEYKSEATQTGDEFQQNRWMMSSIVDDDSEESPKRKLDNLIHRQQKVRMEMGVELDHLEELSGQAKQIVERRNHGISEPPPREIQKSKNAGESHDLFLEA